MKRNLTLGGILGLVLIIASTVAFGSPQEPEKKKTSKHIKIVKVKDGEKIELDTIIEGDKVFVWQGDTIKGGKELKWLSKDSFHPDSIHEHFNLDKKFDFDIKKDDGGNVFIIKSGKDGKNRLKSYKIDADSSKNTFTIDIDEDGEHGKHDIMMWNSDKGNNKMIFTSPDVRAIPHAPHAPGVFFKEKDRNVIDLSDPGIISYNKKKLKGGREKITIIRNEVEEKDGKIHEEFIIHDGGGQKNVFIRKLPEKSKAVKILRKDGGKVEVIEDEKVWTVKEGEERVKVIEEDGKIIHIKEINNNGEKKVEVKVEVEETEKEKK